MKQAKEFSGAQAVGGFFGVPNLDKLEQLGTSPTKRHGESVGESGPGIAVGAGETREALRKRARAKFYSSAHAYRLAQLDSPLKKGYIATLFCASGLTQEGAKITSKYCGHRWCTVCNRIRVAQLIKGYEGPLSLLKDLRFVTLTVPNVPAEHLRETIERMIKQAQAIQGYFKKRHQRGLQGWQLVGIRKMETTHNHSADNYHPHFHFIIQGKEAAQALVSEWLKRVENATYKAQDERKADKGSEKELFKYFSKMVTKVGGKYATLVEPNDVIFQAMRGLRVFQPIGIKKQVSEEIENLQAVEVSGITPSSEPVLWHWDRSDWVNHETGEGLTGYIPSEQAQELVENISLNVSEFQQKQAARLLTKPRKNPVNDGEEEAAKPLAAAVELWYLPDLAEHRQRVFVEMDLAEAERAEARQRQGLFSVCSD